MVLSRMDSFEYFALKRLKWNPYWKNQQFCYPKQFNQTKFFILNSLNRKELQDIYFEIGIKTIFWTTFWESHSKKLAKLILKPIKWTRVGHFRNQPLDFFNSAIHVAPLTFQGTIIRLIGYSENFTFNTRKKQQIRFPGVC